MKTKQYYKNEEDLKNDEINLTNINYSCTKCPSIIEILSINQEKNTIEFQCMNKHNKIIIPINEYLQKMSSYKNKLTNEDKCKIHNIYQFLF